MAIYGGQLAEYLRYDEDSNTSVVHTKAPIQDTGTLAYPYFNISALSWICASPWPHMLAPAKCMDPNLPKALS